MRVLALDTSTRSCSVAVTEDETILAEATMVGTQTHAVCLIDMIRTVLERADIALAEIEGFAVGRGPGSFTGLRIGIATIKALAGAAGKPVVGVSDLEALAQQADKDRPRICPMMDARKGEVYFSLYGCSRGILRRLGSPRVGSPESALENVESVCMFIGEGARVYRQRIVSKLGEHAAFAASQRNIIRASTIGLLSMNRFKERDTDDIVRLAPEYIRKSDAELGFRRKRG